MKPSRVPIFSSVVVIALILQGCGSVATATSAPTSAPATEAPAASSAPIVHALMPGEGSHQEANAHDNVEATTSKEKDVKTGDQFVVNRFERPFTSKDMVYLPYVDITNMAITSDDNFYYIQIELVGLGKGNKLPLGAYGAEFDLNIDGRTEFSVLAKPPFTKDWTTNGVQVNFDGNGDIGGAHMYPDDGYAGNGYDTVIFDSGVGDDPDLAWAHFVQSAKPIVELAIKRSLFEGSVFLWDVLASANPVDPTKLYYNDTYSTQEAGSPRKGDSNYPLNQLWGFDNTCRLPLGFTATGTEPMGCYVQTDSDPPDVLLDSSGSCPPGTHPYEGVHPGKHVGYCVS